MSKGSEIISGLSGYHIERFYQEIIKYEKEKVLSEDSIIRSFINEHYDSNSIYFIMNYIAFSRDILFEIAKRHYNS